METFEQLANNVNKLREEHGLTIRGLAAAAGVDPATILKLERGDMPNLRTLAKVSAALKVPVIFLLIKT